MRSAELAQDVGEIHNALRLSMIGLLRVSIGYSDLESRRFGVMFVGLRSCLNC
jgi:hypothetical protein